jgi:hypothetical protein
MMLPLHKRMSEKVDMLFTLDFLTLTEAGFRVQSFSFVGFIFPKDRRSGGIFELEGHN